VEEVHLNSAQRNILPYLLAFFGAVIGIVGLLTPWVSIGVRGINGSSNGQGKITYLVVGSLLILGLTGFIDQLRNYKKIIALATLAIGFDALVSYAIWLNRVLGAIDNFNDASKKLEDFGGIFGEALTNLANSIQPSITTGFYMVCTGAATGIVASILIFRQPYQNNSVNQLNMEKIAIEGSSSGVLKRYYFGIPQIPFYVILLATVLGLVFIVNGSSSFRINNELIPNSSNSSSPSSTESEDVSSNLFDCLQVANLRNAIKLNQSRFSGDPEPTDIFIATQFKFTNQCDKTVIGIKGSMSFQNVVGDVVFVGTYTDDKTIQVGESVTTSLNTGWTFNQFEDEHGQLARMDESKTRAVLTLSKIAFDDGTSISE
jgi:hypothetical protein